VTLLLNESRTRDFSAIDGCLRRHMAASLMGLSVIPGKVFSFVSIVVCILREM
jgi:hypothetical protein